MPTRNIPLSSDWTHVHTAGSRMAKVQSFSRAEVHFTVAGAGQPSPQGQTMLGCFVIPACDPGSASAIIDLPLTDGDTVYARVANGIGRLTVLS